MNNLSETIYEKEHTTIENLDYFVCATSGALFAYIGGHYEPHKLDNLYYYIMPVALAFLTISFICGLTRIHLFVVTTRLNRFIHHYREAGIRTGEAIKTFTESKTPIKIVNKATHEPYTLEQLKEYMDDNKRLTDETEKKWDFRLGINYYICWVREITLFFGFVCIIASKIMQPYWETVK